MISPVLSPARAVFRRTAASRRACALGIAALSLLAPGVHAQDATRSEAGVRGDVRSQDARPAGTLTAPARRIDAVPATMPRGAASMATPAFAARVVNPFGLTGFPSPSYVTLSVADLDGDGDMDVLASGSNSSFSYFQNTAGPGVTPVFAALVTNPFGLTAPSSGAYLTPDVEDLDGDGDLDVLAGLNTGNFDYFENTAGAGATPAFAAPVTNPFGLTVVTATQATAPSVVDLDGDGDMDVIAGSLEGDLYYFQNTAGPSATPVFAAKVLNPFGFSRVSFYSIPSAGDLDGDGDLDVLMGQDSGALIYFQNSAGPHATPVFTAFSNPFGLTSLGSGPAPSVADLDGDGDMDVLAGDGTGNFFYYENASAPEPITARLTGADGYRMLAAPSPTTTIGGLLGTTIYTQGFPGATDDRSVSTVFRYDETIPGALTLGYVAPASLGTAVGIGRGLFVYVFADEDPRPSAPGTQGGFPKTLTATGRRPLIDFDWGGTAPDAALSYTDSPAAASEDGWNLLGNPFGTAFDWDGTTLVNVNAPVYVYDNVTAAYRSHTRGVPAAGNLTAGMIAPFQGFWVQTNAAAPSIRAYAATTNGGVGYREASGQVVLGLRLRPGAGSALPDGVASEAFLALGVDGASEGPDAFDAFALVPPAPSYVLLGTSESDRVLAIDARPAAAGQMTVALDVSAVVNGAAAGTALVLDWPNLSLPEGWSARLLDGQTGAVVEMTAGGSHPFTLDGLAPRTSAPNDLSPLGASPDVAEALASGRFSLVVTPRGATAGEAPADGALSLSAARPNPTTGGSSLTLTLAEASDVRVSVVDVLGREVAVLAEGVLSAGGHALRVEASALPAGTYVVRATVGAQVLTQRLTVTR